MNKSVYKIAAIVAIIFSALSILEGSRVLLGLSVPDYIVFTPLLIYNIIMGAAGIYVGVIIFRRDKEMIKYSAVVTFFHICTLITIGALYFFSTAVAQHSLNAMIIRSALWLIITLVLWGGRKFFK